MGIFMIFLFGFTAIQGILFAQTAKNLENIKFTTRDELWEFAEPMIKPFVGMPSVDPLSADPDIKRLVIVNYLGSSDPNMQDAAVEIMAKLMILHHPTRASVFRKYLSKDYPISVRLIALCYRMQGAWSDREYWHMTGDERVEFWKLPIEKQKEIEKQKKEEKDQKIKEEHEQWGMILNEIIESKEPPKHIILLGICIPCDKKFKEIIKPENQPLLVKWLYQSGSALPEDKFRIFGMITFVFDSRTVSKALLDWFPTEKNSDIRAYVIGRLGNLSKVPGFQNEDLKPVFELAAKDEDEKIAEKANEILKKLNNQ
jgi:hypothetical protein